MSRYVGAYVLLGVLLVAGTAGAEEAVLSWDGGSCGEPCQVLLGLSGTIGVSAFEAPEWAHWLVAAQYYVVTSEEFKVTVMTPAEGEPLLPGIVEYQELWTEWTEARDGYWVEVRLAHPIPLDEAVFTGRVFFLGTEWLHFANPRFGWDAVAPVYGRTYHRHVDEDEWRHLDYGDFMVRAVVSDSPPTPVDCGTWGVLKAMYR